MTRAALWLALLVAGCSSGLESSRKAEQGDTGFGSAGGAEEDGGADSGATDALGESASWWRLDADLVLVGGDVVASSSPLTATLLSSEREVVCEMTATAERFTPVRPLPDALLVTWWSVEALGWSGECVDRDLGEAVPVALHLGLGTLHPEIEAVLGTVALASDGAADSLNGAYASFEGSDTIYVFGAGGPVEAWAGDAEPATVEPLVDGVWSVRGAYSFPVQ